MNRKMPCRRPGMQDNWLSSLSVKGQGNVYAFETSHASTDSHYSRILYTCMCLVSRTLAEVLSSNLRPLQFSGLLILLAHHAGGKSNR